MCLWSWEFEACWQHLSQNGARLSKSQQWRMSKSWTKQVQHPGLTWSPSYGNVYSICCYLYLVETTSWWLNLSQDISKTALCETLLLKFATMSGKLPSGKIKITILSWKNIFKLQTCFFSWNTLFSWIAHLWKRMKVPPTNKISPNDRRCGLPTTNEIDSMLRNSILTNEPFKTRLNQFHPFHRLFPCLTRQLHTAALCANWTPAMREHERGQLLSTWSLTIIATHPKMVCTQTCVRM